jgi:hypothetical protein
MRNRTLYEALMDFPLAQTGGQLTFLHRLCRENNWTLAYGRRAIDEYKRFVYLAMVSPMPVTPSDAVDQVWHLHLLYTRSYWEDLQAILGRPLHHGPTAGGREEDAKFENWYERTKALYESEFGAEPPPELWPTSEERFHPGHRFRRLDAALHWIIPKPALYWRRSAAALAAMPLTLPLLAASGGVDFLVILVLAWLAILAIGMVIAANATSRQRRRRGTDSSGASGCGGGGCSSGSSGGDCGDGGGSCDGGSSGCGGGGCGGGGCGGGD